MQVLEYEQNTEEWLEFKRGKAGGSRANKLMPSPRMTKAIQELTPDELGRYKAGLPKKDEFYKLVAEQVARPITPNDYEDRLNGERFSMMARGHILEPEAKLAFTEKTGIKLNGRSIVWQSDYSENSILSPDGEVIGQNAAAEIKCPDTHVIIRAYDENQYPQEYKWQVVKYFVTNEKLEKLYFILYTDVMPALPILIFEINREEVLKEIEEYRAFEAEILKQANDLAARLAF